MADKELIRNALDSTSSGASTMTHALCELGDNDMGEGINELWKTGNLNGFVQGVTVSALICCVGVGFWTTSRYIKSKARILCNKQKQKRKHPNLSNDSEQTKKLEKEEEKICDKI